MNEVLKMAAGGDRRQTDPDQTNAPSSAFPLEPFVDAKTVSAFLSIPRADVLRMTRERRIRGYPYKGRLRHVYRYRLSEVSADFENFGYQGQRTMPEAPVSRRRTSNG